MLKMSAISSWLIFAILLLRAAGVLAQGMVSGTVRDTSGNVLAHALVEAVPLTAKKANSTGTVGNTPNPWIPVNGSGGFNLRLPPGQYRIKAKDESDGYPDPSFWLNIDPSAKFPEINVSNQDASDIVVILGKRGAILTGELLDAQSQDPVVGAKIRIQDARNRDAYVEVFTDRAGHFQYTVPSKPILISVFARGYKPVVFNNGSEVTLSSGERRQVDLNLERE
jgi:hypothetical protein